eukprot:734073-Prorocentrum_minimum.AAC.2
MEFLGGAGSCMTPGGGLDPPEPNEILGGGVFGRCEMLPPPSWRQFAEPVAENVVRRLLVKK